MALVCQTRPVVPVLYYLYTVTWTWFCASPSCRMITQGADPGSFCQRLLTIPDAAGFRLRHTPMRAAFHAGRLSAATIRGYYASPRPMRPFCDPQPFAPQLDSFVDAIGGSEGDEKRGSTYVFGGLNRHEYTPIKISKVYDPKIPSQESS